MPQVARNFCKRNCKWQEVTRCDKLNMSLCLHLSRCLRSHHFAIFHPVGRSAGDYINRQATCIDRLPLSVSIAVFSRCCHIQNSSILHFRQQWWYIYIYIMIDHRSWHRSKPRELSFSSVAVQSALFLLLMPWRLTAAYMSMWCQCDYPKLSKYCQIYLLNIA